MYLVQAMGHIFAIKNNKWEKQNIQTIKKEPIHVELKKKNCKNCKIK